MAYCLYGSFALAAAGSGLDFAGFINDARELLNEAFFGETLSFFKVNKGNMSTFEEFFHIVRVAAGVFGIIFNTILELYGANGAEGTFVAENEVNGFVFDETISGVTVLSTNFVAEEGTKANIGNNVEFFAKKIIEHLEALFCVADHEVFARAVLETINGVALATTGGDADEDGHQKQ